LDGPESDGKGAIKTGDNRAPSPGSSKSTGNKKTKRSTQTKQKVGGECSRTEDIEIKREVAAAFCLLSSVQDNKVEIADRAISTIITLLLSGDAEVGPMTELDFWKRRQQKLLYLMKSMRNYALVNQDERRLDQVNVIKYPLFENSISFVRYPLL
jgi:hypothetical protein